jgi:ubiquinone/menaquinone biosynthesis C-methylase UbiE
VKGYSNELLAEHKRKTHLGLIARWADVTNSQRILKTDLFAEAFGLEQFIFDIAQANSHIVAIDVSSEIVARAKTNAKHHGVDSGKYLCCNVKQLPFQDNCIELVISDSTLDHFSSEEDIVTALKELSRVLRVGGTLIVTMDNKTNLTYAPCFFFRIAMRLKSGPYFIGKTLSLTKLRRTLEKSDLGVEKTTAIFHYPHPDRLVRWLERLLRKLGRGRFDSTIRRTLARLDRLEGKKTKYLTGRYIAVKAVKQR